MLSQVEQTLCIFFFDCLQCLLCKCVICVCLGVSPSASLQHSCYAYIDLQCVLAFLRVEQAENYKDTHKASSILALMSKHPCLRYGILLAAVDLNWLLQGSSGCMQQRIQQGALSARVAQKGWQIPHKKED